MSIRWRAAGATDVGQLRVGNEDTWHADAARGVFLVADGMGGHAAGEVASALAAQTLAERLAVAVDVGARGDALAARLRSAFAEAQRRIEEVGARNRRLRGMGTTLTCLALAPDGGCLLGHLGDSRAYRLRADGLEQLTRDHSWVQREIDAGRLTPAAARTHRLAHVITRVLGAGNDDEPDLIAAEARPGDLFLLATDGLTGMLEDDEIAALLARPEPLPQRVAALIDAANANGGRDNITALLVEVLPAAAG